MGQNGHSSPQHQINLQRPIWGCHRQLDDQYRNPNINNRDHLFGQLTSGGGSSESPTSLSDDENVKGMIMAIMKMVKMVTMRMMGNCNGT